MTVLKIPTSVSAILWLIICARGGIETLCCGKKKGHCGTLIALSTDLELCCSLLSSVWLWLAAAAAAAASRFASKAVTTSLLEGGGGLLSGGAGGCPREVGAATEVMVAVTEPEPVDVGSSFLKNSSRLLCNCETRNTKKYTLIHSLVP